MSACCGPKLPQWNSGKRKMNEWPRGNWLVSRHEDHGRQTNRTKTKRVQLVGDGRASGTQIIQNKAQGRSKGDVSSLVIRKMDSRRKLAAHWQSAGRSAAGPRDATLRRHIFSSRACATAGANRLHSLHYFPQVLNLQAWPEDERVCRWIHSDQMCALGERLAPTYLLLTQGNLQANRTGLKGQPPLFWFFDSLAKEERADLVSRLQVDSHKRRSPLNTWPTRRRRCDSPPSLAGLSVEVDSDNKRRQRLGP